MSYLIDNKIGYNDMSDWGYDILRGGRYRRRNGVRTNHKFSQ